MRIHLLFGLLLLMGLLSCHSTEVQHRAPLPKAIVTEELLVTLPSPYNDLIPLERGIRTVGDRYAIIYKKDSVTSILNMSGVEIEGDFETFHTPSFGCGFGYDQKYQDSTRFLRVEADRSLCTFIITDKQGEIHTYIDGEKGKSVV